MASLSDITIKQEFRPCIVDNKKALFHKWIHTKNLLGQEFELGLIEYENGQVEEVTPNNIKFCDNKIKEYLEKRIKDVDKCYEDLIKPYYDKKINIINTSFMSKKEKEEFINKRNCLLVQKHCYQEILEQLAKEKGE